MSSTPERADRHLPAPLRGALTGAVTYAGLTVLLHLGILTERRPLVEVSAVAASAAFALIIGAVVGAVCAAALLRFSRPTLWAHLIGGLIVAAVLITSIVAVIHPVFVADAAQVGAPAIVSLGLSLGFIMWIQRRSSGSAV